MGQRHQLFVIARINGRYRGLTAIHHQWLYGATALKRCLRLVNIFQAAENRIPIQQELLSAAQRNEAFWTTEDCTDDYRPYVPFPMLTTCLVLGASFDPIDGYQHGISLERFNLAYDGGDNNNGITIIDITEVHHVRYCFVDFYGMESQTKVQLMTPLSASTYLWSYYDEHDGKDQEMFGKTIEDLEVWDLVDVTALRDTWPSDDWEDPDPNWNDPHQSEDDSLENSVDDSVNDAVDSVDASASTSPAVLLPTNPVFEPSNQSSQPSVGHSTSPSASNCFNPAPSQSLNLSALSLVNIPSSQVAASSDRSGVPMSNPNIFPRAVQSTNLPSGSLAMSSLTKPVEKSLATATGIRRVDEAPSLYERPTTLRATAMDTLIESLLIQSENDTEDWLSHAEILPDFLSSLKCKLYEKPGLLAANPVALNLLCRVFEDESNVDLRPFGNLPVESIRSILSKLHVNVHLRALNLSGMVNVGREDIRMLLDAKCNLRSIYLLDSPWLSLESLFSLMDGDATALCDLYHTELLTRPLGLPIRPFRTFRSDAEHLYDEHDSQHIEDPKALFFPGNPVIQLIWVKIAAKELVGEHSRFENGYVNWELLIKQARKGWAWDPHLLYGAIPLTDILLPPVKVVTGLLQFLKWAVQAYPSDGMHGFAIAAAKSFATSTSTVSGSKFQVGPLSSALYPMRHGGHNEDWPETMRTMRSGQWTLVVIHEYLPEYERTRNEHPDHEEKIKYALVTPRARLPTSEPSSQPEFRIIDMTTFLTEVMTTPAEEASSTTQDIVAHWNKHSKAAGGSLYGEEGPGSSAEQTGGVSLHHGVAIELCEEEDVRGLLQVISAREEERATAASGSGHE